MNNYYELEDFKRIYLEDSYVLDIGESEDEISFSVEMVLTGKHPLYKPPQKGEQYCYKIGKIIFPEVTSVNWINKDMRPIIDIDNSKDYGNIDSFTKTSEGFHLTGEWGEVVINFSCPIVVWTEDKSDASGE